MEPRSISAPKSGSPIIHETDGVSRRMPVMTFTSWPIGFTLPLRIPHFI